MMKSRFLQEDTFQGRIPFAYMMDQLSDSDDDIDQDLQSNEDDIVQHEEKISRVGKPRRNFFKKPTRTGN